jgi:hypothetical protein
MNFNEWAGVYTCTQSKKKYDTRFIALCQFNIDWIAAWGMLFHSWVWTTRSCVTFRGLFVMSSRLFCSMSRMCWVGERSGDMAGHDMDDMTNSPRITDPGVEQHSPRINSGHALHEAAGCGLYRCQRWTHPTLTLTYCNNLRVSLCYDNSAILQLIYYNACAWDFTAHMVSSTVSVETHTHYYLVLGFLIFSRCNIFEHWVVRLYWVVGLNI